MPDLARYLILAGFFSVLLKCVLTLYRSACERRERDRERSLAQRLVGFSA